MNLTKGYDFQQCLARCWLPIPTLPCWASIHEVFAMVDFFSKYFCFVLRVRLKRREHNSDIIEFLYLYDTATARCRFHRIRKEGFGFLAATGEDHAAAPAARRSRRDAVRCSMAAEAVSIFITLRHVSEKQDCFDTLKETLSSHQIGPQNKLNSNGC